MTNITITGSGLALPVARDPQLLVDIILSASPDDAPCVDVDPIAWLGKRKGLRYKDRATQLAYCAASDALKSAGLLIEDGLTVDACDIAVVGTSNFGNLDTVTSTIDILSAEDTTSTSPMDLPNASSNVLASSVAVRYGLKGPNLMLCNGATSGTDALMVASTLLRAQRARHVVVVGAEPDNKPIQRLISGRGANAGAAIVMETSDTAIDRGARMQAQLERVTPSIGVDSWQGLSHADETVVIGGPRGLGATCQGCWESSRPSLQVPCLSAGQRHASSLTLATPPLRSARPSSHHEHAGDGRTPSTLGVLPSC